MIFLLQARSSLELIDARMNDLSERAYQIQLEQQDVYDCITTPDNSDDEEDYPEVPETPEFTPPPPLEPMVFVEIDNLPLMPNPSAPFYQLYHQPSYLEKVHKKRRLMQRVTSRAFSRKRYCIPIFGTIMYISDQNSKNSVALESFWQFHSTASWWTSNAISQSIHPLGVKKAAQMMKMILTMNHQQQDMWLLEYQRQNRLHHE